MENRTRLIGGLFAALLMAESLWAAEIHDAAAKGELAKVKTILAQNPQLVNSQGMNNWVPLHFAVYSGHKDVVELLVAKGADPNAKDEEDRTVLHWAAAGNYTEIMTILLANGAEVNPPIGHTPLQSAANEGHKEAAKLLIANGADVNAKDRYNRTALHYAAGQGHGVVVDILLANGAKVNATDFSLLEQAACGGLKNLVERLLTDNPNVKPNKLPLHAAALSGHCPIIKLFIERGADVNARDANGETPLQSAALNCQTPAAALLIAAGADVNAGSGQTPICLAAAGGGLELVKFLVVKGASIPTTGSTPLHFAAGGSYLSQLDAEKRRKALVKFFVNKGLDVNGKDLDGATPLHWAAKHAGKDVVALLIEEGAQVNIADKGGRTPLFHAVTFGNKNSAEVLIAHGAAINVKANMGHTALHTVVRLNNVAGCTRNRIDLVALLLAHGANANVQDKRGHTPLHNAVAWGWDSPEIVELLLSKGADVNIKDGMGRTPLDLAYGLRENQEITDLLLKYRAKK